MMGFFYYNLILKIFLRIYIKKNRFGRMSNLRNFVPILINTITFCCMREIIIILICKSCNVKFCWLSSAMALREEYKKRIVDDLKG
jgi:hypothetical protein